MVHDLQFTHYLDAWMHLVRIGRHLDHTPNRGIDKFLKPVWFVPRV